MLRSLRLGAARRPALWEPAWPVERIGTATAGLEVGRLDRLAGPLATVVAAVTAGRHLLDARLVDGHDALEHAVRVAEFARSLQAGTWPIWAPNLGGGYGEPIFLFNPPLLYLLASLFVLLGTPIVLAMNLATVALLVVGGLGAYCWIRPVFGKAAAVVGGVAYAWAPYLLLDVYVRQALTELAAASMLPWALWSLGQTVRTAGRRRLALAGGLVGATFLTSTPAALVTGPAVAAQVLALAGIDRFRGALRGIAALGLGGLLAAGFWVPAALERHVMRFDRLLEGLPAYPNHFLELHQLVGPDWGYGQSLPGPDDRMGFGQGEAQLALAALGLAILCAGRVRGLAGRQALLALGLLAFGVFMSHQWSEPLWRSIAPLEYLQFPWRFLVLAALGLAALAAIPTAVAADGRVAIAAACAAILVLGNWSRAGPSHVIPVGDGELSPNAVAHRDRGQGTAREYETIWVEGRPTGPPAERLVVRSGSASIQELRVTPHSATFLVRARSRTRLRLNTFYFPGWRIYVDDAPRPVQHGNPSGLIEFTVQRGDHRIETRFEPSPARAFGLLLSATGALTLVILVFGDHRLSRLGVPANRTCPAGALRPDERHPYPHGTRSA